MKKTIALYPNHPSQLWVLKTIADRLQEEYKIIWYLREKDISVPLAKKMGIKFKVISKGSKGLINNIIEYFKTIILALYLTKIDRVDLWISKNSAVHMVSKMLGRKSIAFNDDDIEIIKLLAYSSYPFVNMIIAPMETNMGFWYKKTKRITGTFEMLYLHPDRFKPDEKIFMDIGIKKYTQYAIIRLVSLTAHHDLGARGLTKNLITKLIDKLEASNIKVFITSEIQLDSDLEKYRLPLTPDRIHHALYYASLFIGDSQTMTTEAALLGTPAFRINSFVGKISTIKELEKKEIAFGFNPCEEKKILTKLVEILNNGINKDDFKKKIKHFYSTNNDPLNTFLKIIRVII